MRLKIARQEKAKQTEALAERLVAAVQALDVKAAQEALASLRQGKLDKLEVAELLVGRTSLKEWRKLTKMVKMEKIVKRRLSINIKVENVDEDQKKRIVVSPAKKLPEVNCKDRIVKLEFAPIPGIQEKNSTMIEYRIFKGPFTYYVILFTV